ncbi:MAG TPA: hypothetical protein VLM89_10490 [Phycisphaerae bacterium]|nr:hypothetical protein [Phycisphaerae bacterium]
MTVVWLSAAVAAVWIGVVWINRRRVARYDGSGDPAAGIVVFVEPVRWLFIIWGFVGACMGLRQGDARHAIYLFRWSRRAGSLFVLPDLIRRHRLNAKAGRLARFIERLAWEHPRSTIHLIGYSSGVYVAFEAVKLLPAEIVLGRVIAVHGTISPAYDLRPVLARADIVNVFGKMDFLINGIGPLLFGANDRVRSLACGMVGFHMAAERLSQREWSWTDIADGYWGGHFTVMTSSWIRRNIASLLQ